MQDADGVVFAKFITRYLPVRFRVQLLIYRHVVAPGVRQHVYRPTTAL